MSITPLSAPPVTSAAVPVGPTGAPATCDPATAGSFAALVAGLLGGGTTPGAVVADPAAPADPAVPDDASSDPESSDAGEVTAEAPVDGALAVATGALVLPPGGWPAPTAGPSPAPPPAPAAGGSTAAPEDLGAAGIVGGQGAVGDAGASPLPTASTRDTTAPDPDPRVPADAVAQPAPASAQASSDTPADTPSGAAPAAQPAAAAAAPAQQVQPSPQAAAAVPVVAAAPTTPAGASVPADAPRPAPPVAQVVPEVTRLVSRGNGVHRLTMRLQPEALGEVRVTLTVRDGAVQVHLSGGEDAARALADGAPELRRVLEMAGATDARVVVRDSAGQTTGSAGQGSYDTRAGGDSSAPRGDAGQQDQHARTRGGAGARDGLTDGATALRPDPVTAAREGIDLTM